MLPAPVNSTATGSTSARNITRNKFFMVSALICFGDVRWTSSAMLSAHCLGNLVFTGRVPSADPISLIESEACENLRFVVCVSLQRRACPLRQLNPQPADISASQHCGIMPATPVNCFNMLWSLPDSHRRYQLAVTATRSKYPIAGHTCCDASRWRKVFKAFQAHKMLKH